jgi:flavin-dependent dehydrogenase
VNRSTVAIIGAGPAGCTAALTLHKLGHVPVVYERETFPRYRVGESFLPGSLSIFNRLGLQEKIDAAGFIKKPSATFLWGQEGAPWTFSFTTPKTSPWVFDHSIQVDRGEFDKILLDEVKERGIEVHENTSVSNVDISDPRKVSLTAGQGDAAQQAEFDFVIDAGGPNGPLARKLKVRRYDEYFKSFAVWSYFRCPDPFEGDLKGTTYSITFEDGWVWLIPLKDDLYSVGLIVDRSKSAELKEMGPDRFFRETLAKAARAKEILGDSEMVDKVRVIHDWSYDSEVYSDGRYFLSGDSACFTDPLFSQGVHMATQSAVSAAAAIDRITKQEEEAEEVHAWYNRAYRETYDQYHEFLASFYTMASMTEPESEYWNKRAITGADDERLTSMRWFDRLAASSKDGTWSVEDFRDRATILMSIGRHQRMELSDEFKDKELGPARVQWIGQLTKKLNRITRLQWNGEEVILKPYYKVDPETFGLAAKQVLANEQGRDMIKWTLEEKHRDIFRRLLKEDVGYKELIRSLGDTGQQELSSQIVIRLMEAGLLTGYDKHGEKVFIQDRLRFDGVGTEYEV